MLYSACFGYRKNRNDSREGITTNSCHDITRFRKAEELYWYCLLDPSPVVRAYSSEALSEVNID